MKFTSYLDMKNKEVSNMKDDIQKFDEFSADNEAFVTTMLQTVNTARNRFAELFPMVPVKTPSAARPVSLVAE